jgi:hypothetical protein
MHESSNEARRNECREWIEDVENNFLNGQTRGLPDLRNKSCESHKFLLYDLRSSLSRLLSEGMQKII